MKKVRTLIWIIVILLVCIPLMAPRSSYNAGRVAPPAASGK